eukprot:9132236-Alexandrium_andersonii.AAC.1
MPPCNTHPGPHEFCYFAGATATPVPGTVARAHRNAQSMHARTHADTHTHAHARSQHSALRCHRAFCRVPAGYLSSPVQGASFPRPG